MANDENLKPTNQRSKSEARELGKLGGQKSGEVRRAKKLLSDIYARALERKYDKKAGSQIVEDVIMDIITKKDGSSVSMLKELREALEGSKVEHSGVLSVTIVDDIPK